MLDGITLLAASLLGAVIVAAAYAALTGNSASVSIDADGNGESEVDAEFDGSDN